MATVFIVMMKAYEEEKEWSKEKFLETYKI